MLATTSSAIATDLNIERVNLIFNDESMGEIRVYSANHDSTMSRHPVVKRDEVFSVDGQNGTIPRYCVGKDGLICDPLIGVPCLQGGYDFVPEFPKLHHR